MIKTSYFDQCELTDQVIQAFTTLSDPVERAKYDANLKLRQDSDGATLSSAAQAPAQPCPKARKPGPSSPAKPPKKVPTKRSPAAASPAPEAKEASEAKAIWQRWLDAPEEEWEEPDVIESLRNWKIELQSFQVRTIAKEKAKPEKVEVHPRCASQKR